MICLTTSKDNFVVLEIFLVVLRFLWLICRTKRRKPRWFWTGIKRVLWFNSLRKKTCAGKEKKD